jgi:probable rRNA maturation factor
MIELTTNSDILYINISKLADSASNILKLEKTHMVHIELLEDEEIIALNKEFRGKDYLPDVLSFDYRQEKMFDHEISGEIFISLNKAKEQAKEKELPLNYEILFLTTHGLLHTLGFDHNNDEEENEMKDKEYKIMNEYLK